MRIERDEKMKNWSAYNNNNKYIYLYIIICKYYDVSFGLRNSVALSCFLKMIKSIPSDFVGGNELEIFVPVPLTRRLRRLARVTLARRSLRENVKFCARQNAFVAVLQHELGEHLAGVYAHRMVGPLVREPPVGHLWSKNKKTEIGHHSAVY